MKERQELWCHDCQRYVQFDIDVSLNGNHIIIYPECGHEHCRVVMDGKVTEVRWGSRNNNMQAYTATGLSTTTASTYTLYDTGTGGTSSAFTYSAWMDLSINQR